MIDQERVQAALPAYRIGEVIGRGGCGEVLSATHSRLQRQVAIKRIPSQFADDPAVRRRFIDEARLMAAIDHPHVVPIYDYVEHDDLYLLVMEYLPGGTVATRFSTEGFDAASALAVALSCSAGLEAAHRRGVLHRDIKPANLMFAENGTVKLGDFGIAKVIGGSETLVTRAGEVVGTPSYIAPEQARGATLSPATDIYALATMLYQLLAGVLPFPPSEDDENSSMTTLFMHAFGDPTPLRDVAPQVPAPIADVVMRGLVTDPTHRISSAEDFGVALAETAAECWGADWLIPVGIPILGADTIVAGSTRNMRAASRSDTLPVPAATRPMARDPRAGSTTRIRPTQPLTRDHVGLIDIAREDVVPAQQLVRLPSPRSALALAALLALAAIVLAVTGLGTPPRGGDLRPGIVTVAGVDPTTVGEVSLDMTRLIPVTVTGMPADSATLAMVILNMPVGPHEAPLTPAGSGFSAAVTPPLNPHLLAGRATAELTVGDRDGHVAVYRFAMRTQQSATTTAFAAATVVLALFSSAYAESYLRALRRGRSRVTGSIGLPLSAAALGVSAVGATWILLGREPTTPALVGCAALAAAAGISATVAAVRVAASDRYRRRSQRRNDRVATSWH